MVRRNVHTWCNRCIGRAAVIALPVALISGPVPNAPAACDAAPPVSAPYDFARPDAVVELSGTLDEISGIAVLDDSTLLAVEDENGRIYTLDARTGEILGRSRFGRDGDYEDIAVRQGTVWVLDSDGDLFAVRPGDDKADRYETPLTSAYDTEGLATDPWTGALWIVAKEYPGRGYDGRRAVYAFDPDTGKMEEAPVLLVDLDAVEARRGGESVARRTLRALARPFTDMARFKPSAIGFLPGADTLLFVSSTDPVFVLTNRRGEVLHTHPVPDMLRQPEGIALTPRGDLYVSSEARGDRARIALYRRRTR